MAAQYGKIIVYMSCIVASRHGSGESPRSRYSFFYTASRLRIEPIHIVEQVGRLHRLQGLLLTD